jgi:hypothetical protein
VDEEDKVAGAGGEVTPTAAMGSGGGRAREIREVRMEIEVFWAFGLLFSTTFLDSLMSSLLDPQQKQNTPSTSACEINKAVNGQAVQGTYCKLY